MAEYKDKYEKSPEKMTQAEFKMATVGLLNDIVKRLDDDIVKRLDAFNGTVKCVNKHKVYWKITGGIAGGILLPLLAWLIIGVLT
jgi:hypothetical protein